MTSCRNLLALILLSAISLSVQAAISPVSGEVCIKRDQQSSPSSLAAPLYNKEEDKKKTEEEEEPDCE